jgi:hypothetical protein
MRDVIWHSSSSQKKSVRYKHNYDTWWQPEIEAKQIEKGETASMSICYFFEIDQTWYHCYWWSYRIIADEVLSPDERIP